jgi:mannose-6-phosphate isomerase-like protein (cupin superfamily)
VVEKTEGLNAYVKITLDPQAAGPPVHVHEAFDEQFVVEKGTLSLLINGHKKTLHAGERLTVPRGTPHKPFNETNEPVVSQTVALPAPFVFGLMRLYDTIDRTKRADAPQILWQLAALGNGFDTWVADAPRPAQKALRWLLSPTARLLGY